MSNKINLFLSLTVKLIGFEINSHKCAARVEAAAVSTATSTLFMQLKTSVSRSDISLRDKIVCNLLFQSKKYLIYTCLSYFKVNRTENEHL
jgi:hypothetical protein